MLVLTGFLLVLLLSFLLVQYFKLLAARARFPPGPTPLPIVGNMVALGFEIRYEKLMQLAKTYGNIFTVWLGHTPVIVLNGCQAVRDALVSHSDDFSGRPQVPIYERMSRGKGVLMSNGHTWKQQRNFGLMTLRNLGFGKKVVERRIQEEAQYLTEAFAALKGAAVNPALGIVTAVTNVISSVVFGHRFSSEDKVLLRIIKSMECISESMVSMWALLYDAFPWLVERLPGESLKRMFESNDFVENYTKLEIDIHKENGVPEEPQDVIDFYLAKISKTSDDVTATYDEHNLIRLLVELFGAGMETTAYTLRWALLYMVTQLDIQEKVQEELDAVLGKSHIIQYEDRMKLPYTNAVIHEIQRHSNMQSFGIFRQAVRDTSLQGYHVKKGTILLPNLASSMHDPDYWKSPDKFNPGRFMDKDGKFVDNNAFIAFSAGHRACLGEPLARTEIFIFFSNLLRTFNLCLPDGVKEVNMNYVFGASLKPLPFKICALVR